MLGSTRRSLILMGLLLSLGVAVLLAAAGLDWRTLGSRQILLLAVAATGLCMIALAANSIWRIHARLERLRGHVALAASDTPLPPILTEAPDSIDRLHLAVADLIGRRRAAQAELDRRLEQIMGALPDPVLVVTPEGLVSLVNAAGRALFAERSSMVGTSVYDLLTEGGLAAAMAESRGRGVAVDCRLDLLTGESLEASVSAFADAGGAVIRFAAGQGILGQVEHDLALHDRRPPLPVTAETPLAALPALVLDTETTGLNPERDRIVSLGAVRLQGAQLFRTRILDLLINPGRQIPAVSTAVHGISDLMVLPAPGYADVAPKIMAALQGVAVIGHHTAFDLAILRRASKAIGVDWQDPPWLDTALLFSALHPEARHFDLDAVAEAFGLAVHGRHTALGDALATAELYLRMLPQLEARGIATLGQAMAFQMTGRKTAQAHHLEGNPAP
ncbi:MAG TPA: exonuclease domain-containing protein [Candidatus Binatia bacterium]|nr:exonuclease domain-containing protein [Candidatus Binatia bacterium]